MRIIITLFDRLDKKYHFSYIISASIASIILVSSVIPQISLGLQTGLTLSGTAAHFLAYFILSLALSINLMNLHIKKAAIKAALIAGIYGFMIEMIQLFIPYRSFELSDMIVNFLAASVVPLTFYILLLLRGNKINSHARKAG